MYNLIPHIYAAHCFTFGETPYDGGGGDEICLEQHDNYTAIIFISSSYHL
jgi:hypothetical protein